MKISCSAILLMFLFILSLVPLKLLPRYLTLPSKNSDFLSSYNLYKLGKREGLQELIISSKFEPLDSWLLPFYDSLISFNKTKQKPNKPASLMLSSLLSNEVAATDSSNGNYNICNESSFDKPNDQSNCISNCIFNEIKDKYNFFLVQLPGTITLTHF